MAKNKYIKSHFLPTTIKMTPVYLVNLLVQITKFPHLITTLGYMILSKTHQFINSINTIWLNSVNAKQPKTIQNCLNKMRKQPR